MEQPEGFVQQSPDGDSGLIRTLYSYPILFTFYFWIAEGVNNDTSVIFSPHIDKVPRIVSGLKIGFQGKFKEIRAFQ
jgi:hypothetical protein